MIPELAFVLLAALIAALAAAGKPTRSAVCAYWLLLSFYWLVRCVA